MKVPTTLILAILPFLITAQQQKSWLFETASGRAQGAGSRSCQRFFMKKNEKWTLKLEPYKRGNKVRSASPEPQNGWGENSPPPQWPGADPPPPSQPPPSQPPPSQNGGGWGKGDSPPPSQNGGGWGKGDSPPPSQNGGGWAGGNSPPPSQNGGGWSNGNPPPPSQNGGGWGNAPGQNEGGTWNPAPNPNPNVQPPSSWTPPPENLPAPNRQPPPPQNNNRPPPPQNNGGQWNGPVAPAPARALKCCVKLYLDDNCKDNHDEGCVTDKNDSRFDSGKASKDAKSFRVACS